MAALEVLVDIAQLASAANNMNTALETYRGAIDNVNAAAQDLASKWEGDGQVAFVADQDAAYRWYNSLVEVTREMIAEAKRTVERYRDRINILKGQM
ncbi:MAG: WXG100 family type VII secretion target [Oscillospiraceae bacterium]|nr:WXG100 family type VII secretion target [Oscillospiraceae bacterium]